MRAVIHLCLWVSLAGCAGKATPTPAEPESPAPPCALRLAARAPSRAASAQPPTAPVSAPVADAAPSRLIVEAKLPLARLASELERSVAPRLAEERGRRLGPAGVLHYHVDRGAFSVTSVGGQLVIEAPLQGRAEACSGGRCYAACEPRALARAELPLWLQPDYRFAPARVTLQFTQGCKVRALGGLLNIDVTGLLKSALRPQLERVAREIDARLPDVRAEVERAWTQLTAPRPLPLVGCLLLAPLGLVQGPMVESGGQLHARFALLARPELRTDCSDTGLSSVSLPPLASDPAMPEEDVVTLGMALPLASLARAFTRATPAPEPRPIIHVAAAELTAVGSHVTAELELGGELCGSLALHAEPVFAGEQGVLTLRGGRLDPTESTRVRAAGVDPAALAQRLAQLPRLATPLSLPLLRAAPAALGSLYAHPELALNVRISALRGAGAAARGPQVVARVEARGALLLEPR